MSKTVSLVASHSSAWRWVFIFGLSVSVLLGFSAFIAQGVNAQAKNQALSAKTEQMIKENIESSRPDLKVKEIQKTEKDGVLRVKVQDRGDIYVLDDGKYFFVGDLYRADKTGLVNVSDAMRSVERAELIAEVKKKDTIVFAPKGEVKKTINVFTDVDCGYCRKIHQEVPQLNAMGVEVRYLAFPRAGVGSQSYNKIASAWCAKDQQTALTKLKNRESIPNNVCDGNPVASQYDLGQKLGVSGTPSIVLPTGEVIPGYLPADQLATRIGL